MRVALSPEITRTRHKELFKHPSNSIYVYTDGSGIDNNIGAAAVSPLTRCIKLAHMRNTEISTVYAVELQGINLALQILDEDIEKGARKTEKSFL